MHKAIHITKSLEKANRTSQNLSISMSLPTMMKKKARAYNKELIYKTNLRRI